MSLLQFSWSIDNSLFKVSELLYQLLRSNPDEGHVFPLMALEALGQGLLVDPKRIDEGLEALRGGQRQKLTIGDRFGLFIGSSNSGLAQAIQKKAPQCASAFVLAIACKIYFTDSQIGSLFVDLLIHFGLYQKIPVSRVQMGQLLGSLSAYGDELVPTETFRLVTTVIQERAGPGSSILKIFWQADIESLAEILAKIFQVLPKTEIKRLTIEGQLGGAFIASILLWLIPDQIEILFDGARCFGNPGAKVALNLKSLKADQWIIQEWHEQTALEKVIISPEELLGYEKVQLNFFPASSGREIIKAQFSLDNEGIEKVGQLATALVMTLLNHGYLFSSGVKFDISCRKEWKFLAISKISQTTFRNNSAIVMRYFGWASDEEFVATSNLLALALSEGMLNSMTADDYFDDLDEDKPLILLNSIFRQLQSWMKFQPGYPVFDGLNDVNITHSAVFLAIEALYASVFDKLPNFRSLRGCRVSSLNINASILLKLVFHPIFAHSYLRPPSFNANSFVNLQEFRRQAIMAMIPGCPRNIQLRDLIFSFNGYVTFLAPLKSISTDRKHYHTEESILIGLVHEWRNRIMKEYRSF